MIDISQINDTIDDIRRNGNTIQAAERLAMMYILRDHMMREEPAESGYSQAAVPSDIVTVVPSSPFLDACNGAPMEEVFPILDAHMEAIRVLYPREYEAINKKINGIK